MPEDTKKTAKVRKFGVYQQRHGSYTLGDATFTPLKAVATSAETAELACDETSPVRFFDTAEDANKEVARLQLKLNPPKREEEK